ncbi:LVIVD repeat-containing protein [Chloroflexota bacterium]
MKRIFLLILIPLVFLGCGAPEFEPEISPQVVGEWKSEEVISGGTIGEIDGKEYLFLMTFPGSIPSKPVLHILDLRDPAVPVEVATLEAPISVLFPVGRLRLSGTVLYVPIGGSEVGGLWSVDVSDPASPREISLLNAGFPAISLALSGEVACIQGFPSRVFLFVDVSDPANPRQVGEEFRLSREQGSMFVHSGKMEVSGSLLYVTDRDGLDIVDISSPGSPREVGFYANPLWTGEEPGVVEDIQHGAIEQITGIEGLLPDGFYGIVLSGQYAYITAAEAGLRVLDVSNPASPQEVAQLDMPEAAHRISIYEDTLCLLGMELVDSSVLYTVHLVDISEPETPVVVGSVEDISASPSYSFVVATDGYVYFVSATTVRIIDIYGSN